MHNIIKSNNFAEDVKWRQLDPRGVLKVTGEDATCFLQGQFSQDLGLTETGEPRYGFWLSSKGKVEGDAIVMRVEECFCWIFSWSMTVAEMRKRLETYLVADDVVLTEETHNWTGWQLVGSGLRDWVAEFNGERTSLAESGVAWTRVNATSEVSALMVAPVRPNWPSAWKVATDEWFERNRIEAGWPVVPVDLGRGDLPQEAGVESIGVSFRKGCYLGQEVMARIQNTGRVRRRLCRVKGRGEAPSGLNEELWCEDKVLGTLRSRISDGHGNWVGLAMVSLAAFDFPFRVWRLGNDGEVGASVELWEEAGAGDE